MNKDRYLSKQLIDHHIQADILKKLASADKAVRFSDLKEDGIENSLFMYHANKLIDRGLISKADEGFELTAKGARWVNHIGVLLSFDVLTPRPLVQFVIYGPNESILLVSRKGQLKNLLNDYMLPGKIYSYGKTLGQNADDFLASLSNEPLPLKNLLTIADVIHQYDDDFTHHVISHIFSVTVTWDALPIHEDYIYEWVPLKSIEIENKTFSNSQFIPLFISSLDHIKPHESYTIKV